MTIDDRQHEPPARLSPAGTAATAAGAWTMTGLGELTRRGTGPPRHVTALEAGDITHLDTAGAVLLANWRSAGVRLDGLRPEWLSLVDRVTPDPSAVTTTSPPHTPLERLGRATAERLGRAGGLLSFLGETVVLSLPLALRPDRLRWRQLFAEIQAAGVTALPIIGLLAFLMGVVMAYQAGSVLRAYGANIFLVDLVGITMLREMAPLLVAIIVAGRTGSSYAAEIGTMRITDELDALRSMGITVNEMLVLPKILALLIVLPLLSVWADALGVLGGMAVATTLYGISTGTFLAALPEAVGASTFWAGLSKTPVFAFVIALVGCHQGLSVRGSAAEVGRATTLTVVQAIFLVIIIDALFSIGLQRIGL